MVAPDAAVHGAILECSHVMSTAAAPPDTAPQRVAKVRRDYNRWVGRETMEDYALRFTPRGFRRWSEWRVANTAFGAASFLILEAVGATLLVQYGFTNAALAIVATGLVIFLAGWPVSVYAARHGLDMDLLTRGAGFGYIGSTITSLIYASFTFIFFALEAAVMAYALELAFDVPPAWGYLICALVVIPLATHGVTAISRLQVWTQPLWLAMLIVPYVVVFQHHPDILQGLAPTPARTARTAASTCWPSAPPPRWASRSSRRWASRSTTCASCLSARRPTAGAGSWACSLAARAG
jgi:hypothetical protein